MKTLISKIRIIGNRGGVTFKKIYEIHKNKDVGKQLSLMRPVQKKFTVYEEGGRSLRFPRGLKRQLGGKEGGFDSIEDCERHIEISSLGSFDKKYWFKSIETEQDKNGSIIINWVLRKRTTYDENNQIIHGILESFHGNGIQSSLKEYHEGQLTKEMNWNENGILTSKTRYVKIDATNDIYSIRESYAKGGKVLGISNYRNDILHGVVESFSNSTEVWFQERYSNGVKHGPFKNWHKKGCIRQKGRYWKGKLDGNFKEYDLDGNIIKDENYNEGVKKES
jgi:antitoxin component YwqK of YwqJK toxin-antitoxin module